MFNSQCKNCLKLYNKVEMKIIIGICNSNNGKCCETYTKYCLNCFGFLSDIIKHKKFTNIKIFNEALEFKEANEYLKDIRVLIKKFRLLE